MDELVPSMPQEQAQVTLLSCRSQASAPSRVDSTAGASKILYFPVPRHHMSTFDLLSVLRGETNTKRRSTLGT